MEPRREGTPCYEELRSGRVVAVGVNSIREEINVRKVIPPGFIMILWEKEKAVSTSRKGQEETGSWGNWPRFYQIKTCYIKASLYKAAFWNQPCS